MPVPTERELTEYLHGKIPLSRVMRVEVVRCDGNSVALMAPLGPNINHCNTVFGGSATALALLSGWTLLHARLLAEGSRGHLVIQEHSMRFRSPISGAFTALCELPPRDAWERFIHSFKRKGAGRLKLNAVLRCDDVDAAFFEGEYVAMGPERAFKSWPHAHGQGHRVRRAAVSALGAVHEPNGCLAEPMASTTEVWRD